MAKGSANVSMRRKYQQEDYSDRKRANENTAGILERFHLSPNKQCQSTDDDQWRGERYTTV